MLPPDALYISHMLGAINRLSELMAKKDREAFDQDWIVQNAAIRELEVLGEAAGRMSRGFVKDHPEIPWREITGLRHKLIHDYFVVDLNIVWHTATVNVPEVAPLLKTAAASIGVDQTPREGK